MMMASHTWPVVKNAGYADIKAYFNVDGGCGRIRGVSLQRDLESMPLPLPLKDASPKAGEF
jgi:hypothetical protein